MREFSDLLVGFEVLVFGSRIVMFNITIRSGQFVSAVR